MFTLPEIDRAPRQRAIFLRTGLLAMCSLVLSPAPALADHISADLVVTATVEATCRVSTTDLAFGIYTGAQLDTTATITVTCSNLTPYQVTLSDGLHYNAGRPGANMAGPGGAFLAYAHFQNAVRTTWWGGTYGTDGQTGTGNGSAQVLTVYGRIAAGQNVQPGAYTDTDTATVHY
jgi:spore coat protein U-like protein